MPWKETDKVNERRDFVVLAESGALPFAELCRRFGVSRPTGYEWLSRWRNDGDGGLEDRSRRPLRSPNRTSEEVEQLVVGLRLEHPRWGGRKISRVLENRGLENPPVPSTVTGILRRNSLLGSEPEPRGFERWERPAPNELWQMDFKGWFELDDRSRCHTFAMLDDHSRYNLALKACNDEKTTTVQSVLVGAFRTYGLPEAILCDNGSPWGSDRNYQWTKLGVWLCDVGVDVIHSRPYHPQTAGKEERFHLTLDWEVISTRRSWATLESLQNAYDDWRSVYNHERPHDSLELDVPADRYQPSPRPFPETIEPVEYPTDYTVRKVGRSAHISFNGRKVRVGRAFIGYLVGVRPTTTHGIYHVHYRQNHIKTIDLTT